MLRGELLTSHTGSKWFAFYPMAERAAPPNNPFRSARHIPSAALEPVCARVPLRRTSFKKRRASSSNRREAQRFPTRETGRNDDLSQVANQQGDKKCGASCFSALQVSIFSKLQEKVLPRTRNTAGVPLQQSTWTPSQIPHASETNVIDPNRSTRVGLTEFYSTFLWTQTNM